MHPDDIRVREGVFEVTGTFIATRRGECTINNEHRIKSGDRIGRIREIENPLIPVPGYACSKCIKVMPRAAKE